MKTFQQKSRRSNNWELLQRPCRPPHFHPPCCVQPQRAAQLSSSPRGKVVPASREEGEGKKSRSDKESQALTMKPLFMLLVSTTWTLTGAQYYYQGLMDYLENRLLAIEVRKIHSHQQNCNISPFFRLPFECVLEFSRRNVSSCLSSPLFSK